MIKENQKLLDAAVIVVSYIFAWYIRFRSGLFALDEWYLSRQSYMKLLYVIVPVFLILYYAFRLYVPKRIMGRRLEAWRVLQANVIGLMGLILILYVLRMGDISRTMLFVFGCSNVFFEVVERNVIRLILRRIRRQGYNQKHMILVGYSRAAPNLNGWEEVQEPEARSRKHILTGSKRIPAGDIRCVGS